MEYLIGYFLIALFVAPAVVWGAWEKRVRWYVVSLVFVFYPLVVALMIQQMLIRQKYATRCAWCGEKYSSATGKKDRDEHIRQHTLVCEKHPLAKRIRELEEKLDELNCVRAPDPGTSGGVGEGSG